MSSDYQSGNDADLDFDQPILGIKKSHQSSQSDNICLEEFDSRQIQVQRVPQVASATCQGQILLKPLSETIAFADISKNEIG